MAQSLNAPKADKTKPARAGRKSKSPNPPADAGIGHNAEPLTEDEQAALQLHHELKVRAQIKKADVAKSAYDLERSAVNDLVKVACGELKVLSGEFRDYLADKDLTETEYRKKALVRATLRKRGGMPDINGQYALDLPSKADTADEAVIAYEDGLRAGRRADDPVPPKEIAPILHQDWMRGWHDGQTENARLLGVAEAVIARRATPKADPEPESQGADALDPDAIDDQARKLKRSGFLETGGVDAEQALVAAE